MSGPRHTITYTDALVEIMRIDDVMQRTYPQMVQDGKISPYTRDHRLKVNQFIINHFKQLIQNGKAENNPGNE